MQKRPRTRIIHSVIHQICKDHGITSRKLSDLLRTVGDPANQSTAHRFWMGTLNEPMYDRVKAASLRVLPGYLQSIGVSQSVIDAAMIKLTNETFKGENLMSIQKFELPPSVQKAFNFRDAEGRSIDPFRNAPSCREEVFYPTQLRAVMDRIIEAVKFQHFICVTGEIGSGKTTLKAMLMDHVSSSDNLRVVWPEFFDMFSIKPAHVATSILDEFAVAVPLSTVRRASAVKNLLASESKRGTCVAIGVDECHRMNDGAISSLKNFLEMSSGGFQRYLGVICFGQPQFAARLAEPKFREIYERITHIEMPDFRSVAAEYLAHRIRLAGQDINTIFDQEAIDMICQNSPTPLALGNICNKALAITVNEFGESKATGALLKTKMHFAERQQGFAKRA